MAMTGPPTRGLDLRSEVMTVVTEDGDRDRLRMLIAKCNADPSGLAILTEAQKRCNTRWHALSRDLRDTISAWHPVERDSARTVSRLGERESRERKAEPLEAPTTPAPVPRPPTRVPSDLANKVLECASTTRADRDLLTELIERW